MIFIYIIAFNYILIFIYFNSENFFNFFEWFTKLKPNIVLYLLYLFGYANFTQNCIHEYGVSKPILTNFYQSFREACINWLKDEGQSPIGGYGRTVIFTLK